jgi:hypothetical protein
MDAKSRIGPVVTRPSVTWRSVACFGVILALAAIAMAEKSTLDAAGAPTVDV